LASGGALLAATRRQRVPREPRPLSERSGPVTSRPGAGLAKRRAPSDHGRQSKKAGRRGENLAQLRRGLLANFHICNQFGADTG